MTDALDRYIRSPARLRGLHHDWKSSCSSCNDQAYERVTVPRGRTARGCKLRAGRRGPAVLSLPRRIRKLKIPCWRDIAMGPSLLAQNLLDELIHPPARRPPARVENQIGRASCRERV